MSRDDFANLVNAAERSISLRTKLRDCSDEHQLIKLAAEYGFQVTLNDLRGDSAADEIINWFKTSKISPIKKTG